MGVGMRYLKRKFYALLALGIWLVMMRCAYVIASHYVQGLPRLGQSLEGAVSMMYWLLPAWIIILIFWYFAPVKTTVAGQKLTKRQKKMIKRAKREARS